MKKVTIGLILSLISITAFSQAQLGMTEYKIRNDYPEKRFTTGTTTKGTRYISADFTYGNMTFYFNSDNVSFYCLMIPTNMTSVNTLAEIFNKNYTITSSTSWTAYLKEGGVMKIKLEYLSESQVTVFTYSY